MQSALSFAPLCPVGFINFHEAGRGEAGQSLLFAGRGGAAYFSTRRGGATIPVSNTCKCAILMTQICPEISLAGLWKAFQRPILPIQSGINHSSNQDVL